MQEHLARRVLAACGGTEDRSITAAAEHLARRGGHSRAEARVLTLLFQAGLALSALAPPAHRGAMTPRDLLVEVLTGFAALATRRHAITDDEPEAMIADIVTTHALLAAHAPPAEALATLAERFPAQMVLHLAETLASLSTWCQHDVQNGNGRSKDTDTWH